MELPRSLCFRPKTTEMVAPGVIREKERVAPLRSNSSASEDSQSSSPKNSAINSAITQTTMTTTNQEVGFTKVSNGRVSGKRTGAL